MQGDEGQLGRLDLVERRVALEGAVVALAGLDEVLYEAPGGELGAWLGTVDAVVAAGELARVRIAQEALERGEIGTRGAGSGLSPVGWVMAHAPSTRAGGAGMVVSLAVEFAKAVNAPVVAAMTAGRIPVRSGAAVIAEADKLRPLLVEGAEGCVVEGLIAMAAAHGPRGCRLVRPRLLARYGLDEVMQREQDAAKGFVSLSQPREHGPGIFEYALTLDTEGMAVLEAGLGPLSAPKPAGGERDLRGSDRRRGDALVALVRRAVAAGDSVPATTKAQLFITMDYDRLRTGLRTGLGAGRAGGTGAEPTGVATGLATGLAAGEVAGGMQAGVLLGPETVRRVACDATVLPIVLGGGGEVLDWGRARRLFTPAQTKRLWLRDGGCTYPGCDAPAQWCDAHHLVHWADFGPSDLANATLLCEHHHQLVHRRRLAGAVVDTVVGAVVDTVVTPGDRAGPGGGGDGRGGPVGSRVEWDLTVGSYDQLLAHRGARDDRAEPA